jgi:hypothetical protein
MDTEVQILDTLFELSDAEFNSDKAVHDNYSKSKGEASWARYYLLNRIRQVASDSGLFASHHLCLTIAKEIAKIWYLTTAK